MRDAIITTIISLFFLLLLSGCDIFDTRDPEDPAGQGTPAEIAVKPSDVFERLRGAILLRDPELHLIVIDDSMKYVATIAAYEEYYIFDEWSYSREDNFIRRLLTTDFLPADSSASIEFTSISETEWGDSATFSQTYALELHNTEEGLPTLYGGLMELHLIRGNDGGWRIKTWIDDSGGEEPTMSRLRATL